VAFLLAHGFGTVWSVTLDGVTQASFLPFIVFFETPGSYAYTAAVVYGFGSISPSSGPVTVVDQTVVVPLDHT